MGRAKKPENKALNQMRTKGRAPVFGNPARKWLFARIVRVCRLAAIVLTGDLCSADSLRVTSWNLGLNSGLPAESRQLEEMASALKELDPDVILLQGVPDWHSCAKLTEALGSYNVLICSAFKGASLSTTGQTQVAILSKRRAYFTWSEGWQSQRQQSTAEGMAFAAIQTRTQRLGFFTALADNRQTSDALAYQILKRIDSIGQWETNQVQTFVIGASYNAAGWEISIAQRRARRAFERAGLVDAAEGVSEELKATLKPNPARSQTVGDTLFAGTQGVPLQTRITKSAISEHYPITCEIELDPDKVSTALELRADNRRQQQLQTSLLLRKISYACGGAVVFAVALALWRAQARKRRAAILTTRGGLPVRIPPTPATPVRPVSLAQPPARPSSPNPEILSRRPRPVLRIESPSTRHHSDSEGQPPSVPPTLPSTEHRADQGIVPPEPPPPNTPLAQQFEVRQGVITELSGWLKQKLVSRLISDRSQMMEAQQLATRMATTLDQRLARIEEQIQKQNQAYTKRIEELNQELAAAREENRELIRERIEQVKAEMEAARARVLAEANLDNTRYRI